MISAASSRPPSAGPRRAGILRLAPILVALAAAGSAPAAAARRSPPRPPNAVLWSAAAGERAVQVDDLRFVFFRRSYYQQRAPRSEEASGRRVQVEDRRKECRCLRFEDWSKTKFKLLRQIEISYPPGGRVALLRLTERTGGLREVRADTLFGAKDSAPPSFSAVIAGSVREFPLVLGSDPGDDWPEERLVRILLVRSPPPPPRRR